VNRRSGLFRGTCLESGWLRNGTWSTKPVERKLTKVELREAYRLWAVHRDIREGKARA
jgi:hypothetical protein